jgi:sortase (surface protein transpeptidase)
LAPDRTLEVPPLDADAPAGWFDRSPTPGENGAAVIVGHVDSARDGAAVFYRLRFLQVGDMIDVGRADGSTIRFAVTGMGVYPKSAFPSTLVYGNRGYPALQLITCGGSFDRARGSYRSNLVVFTRVATG